MAFYREEVYFRSQIYGTACKNKKQTKHNKKGEKAYPNIRE
jgi:hypothetical protein